jgi:hypothetical protein
VADRVEVGDWAVELARAVEFAELAELPRKRDSWALGEFASICSQGVQATELPQLPATSRELKSLGTLSLPELDWKPFEE